MPKTLKPGTSYQHENGKTYLVTVQEVMDLTNTKTKPKPKPKQKAKRKPRKPFKKVFKLFSKRDEKDPDMLQRYRVPMYPTGLVKYSDKIHCRPKKKKATSCYITFWIPRFERDYQHGGIWVGGTQYPNGSDDACRFWDWDEGATAESIAEKILRLPSTGFGTYTEPGGWNGGMQHQTDNENIVVSSEIWKQMSRGLRKRFLRNVFADNIYIDLGLEE